MLGREIVDETDIYVDMHKKNPVHRLGGIGSSDTGTNRASLSSLGGLAPLLRGVVERRSARRDSMNSSPGPRETYPPPSRATSGSGFGATNVVKTSSGLGSSFSISNPLASFFGGGAVAGVESPTLAENETLPARNQSSVTPLLGSEGDYQYSDDDDDDENDCGKEEEKRGRRGGGKI